MNVQMFLNGGILLIVQTVLFAIFFLFGRIAEQRRQEKKKRDTWEHLKMDIESKTFKVESKTPGERRVCVIGSNKKGTVAHMITPFVGIKTVGDAVIGGAEIDVYLTSGGSGMHSDVFLGTGRYKKGEITFERQA